MIKSISVFLPNSREDYGDHVRIEFEMMPPLGMLPHWDQRERRIDRVLSLLGVVIITYFLFAKCPA